LRITVMNKDLYRQTNFGFKNNNKLNWKNIYNK
jgi:hypothetical protein